MRSIKSDKRLIAITGGIGSGKSVVCRILAILGHPVYDCDSRAREIMDTSDSIKQELQQCFGEAIVSDGCIDRVALSRLVFGDPEQLKRLNAIVHRHVIDDILQWSENRAESVVFVETAIAQSSGLSRLVDEIWEVTAPDEVRVQRVMARNGMKRADVEKRMASQADESQPADNVRYIVNDGVSAVLPQVSALLESVNVG